VGGGGPGGNMKGLDARQDTCSRHLALKDSLPISTLREKNDHTVEGKKIPTKMMGERLYARGAFVRWGKFN